MQGGVDDRDRYRRRLDHGVVPACGFGREAIDSGVIGSPALPGLGWRSVPVPWHRDLQDQFLAFDRKEAGAQRAAVGYRGNLALVGEDFRGWKHIVRCE